jgi:CopG family nickel-responsive transcriptional regulator
MSDLVRFGVAMDRALLAEFDQRIATRGYENRSEALRDLVRADLTRAAWDSGARVAATITLIYSTEVREIVARLTDVEREHAGVVVASLRVPLARERSLEVMVLQGAAGALEALAGRLSGTRGVLSCALTPATALLEGVAAAAAVPSPAAPAPVSAQEDRR